MSIFNKQSSKLDPETAGAKRDVTIVNEPKKRPDHVRVESHDCAWSIPLTLDEQYDLGQVYENGFNYEEREMLRNFVEGMYLASSARIAMEITLVRPGEVNLKATSGLTFKKARTVRYEEIGQVVCEWIVEAQSRKDLVADLVASIPVDAE